MTMYDSTDFASTEFARHPDGMIAANLGVGVAWHGHLDARQEFLVWRSEDEMARGGWAPVMECPDPEQHGPVDYKVLLEQAERERDEARGALRARLGVLAESRPLTPDAITDEMVDAAVAGREDRGWFTSASPEDNRDEMRAIISDALAARRDKEKRAACGCDLTGPVPPAVHLVDRHEEKR